MGDNRGEEKEGEVNAPGQEREAGLDGGDEGAVGGDIAAGHAGGVEGEAGIAVAVEEDEAAGGVSAFSEKMHGFAGGEIGGGCIGGRGLPGGPQKRSPAKKEDGRLRQSTIS